MTKEKHLNKKQLEIIKDNSKFILVSAGAGTGKTTTIVGKIKYLTEEKNVHPEEIICISFTNESTNELKKKLNNKVDCLTFHKFSLNILARERYNIANEDLLNYTINEYFENIIFNFPKNIKRLLSYFKIKHNDKNYIKKYNNIKKDKLDKIKKDINIFIKLLKTNNLNNSYILSFIKKEQRINNQNLLIIIYHIANIYEKELESTRSIDFDDMINKATDYVKRNGLNKKIKYLIIDEFQDTSKSKFNFIEEIQKKTNCNIFVVGDDFQSIYKFTGCDLNIFLDFEKRFKDSKIYKLEKTYRNSNELVSLAGAFIMKNKRQLKKNLYSDKQIKKPINIIYYKKFKTAFIKTIEKIHSETKKPILVLGRNNYDIDKIIDNKTFLLNNNQIIYTKNKGIKLKYLTVHKAKGLEEETVILINLLNNKNGFPNKKDDNPILEYIKSNNDEIEYAEERRLFYVAITRTKSKNYIITKKNNESTFVKELIKKHKKFIAIKKSN